MNILCKMNKYLIACVATVVLVSCLIGGIRDCQTVYATESDAPDSAEQELPQGIYRSENGYWYYAYRSLIDEETEDGGDIVIVGRDVYEVNAPSGLLSEITEDDVTLTTFNIPAEIDGHKVTAIGNPYQSSYVNPNTSPEKFKEYECGFNNLDEYDLVVVPEGVDTIYRKCFYSSGFHQVRLPDTLENIGESAFFYDVNLEKINIPESVTSIGGRAFRHTLWMNNKRTESAQGLVIVNGILIDGIAATGAVVVPQSVSHIAEWSFSGTGTGGDDIPSTLSSVSIPSSVKTIGMYAFALCSALEKVDIQGSGIESLGQQVFRGTAIKEIYFPKTIKTIPLGVCYGCTELSKVTIAGAETIETSAFQACAALKDVAFSDKLRELGVQCFSTCSSLNEINIPAEVTIIKDRAFKYCVNLTRVVLPENLEELGKEAFYVNTSEGADKVVITIPEKMTDISGLNLLDLDYATLRVLAGGEVQKYIDDNSVPTYQTYMKGMQGIYEGTVNITNNNVTNNETTNNVTNNNITNNITKNETNIIDKSTKIDNPVVNIDQSSDDAKEASEKNMAGKVFTYKKSKYKVNDDEKSVTFICMMNSKQKILSIPQKVRHNEVSFKVTKINDGACKKMKKLEIVTIGADVETIGDKAFYNCTRLKKVTFGKNVEDVGKMAFYGDKKLKSIIFKNIKNLKTVEKAAFYLRSGNTDKHLKLKQTSKKKMIGYLKNSGVKVKQ